MPSGYWHHIEYAEGGYGLSVRTRASSFPILLRGAYNLIIQRRLDDIMRKLFGQKWFNLKKSIARKRADRAIKEIERREENRGWQLGGREA